MSFYSFFDRNSRVYEYGYPPNYSRFGFPVSRVVDMLFPQSYTMPSVDVFPRHHYDYLQTPMSRPKLFFTESTRYDTKPSNLSQKTNETSSYQDDSAMTAVADFVADYCNVPVSDVKCYKYRSGPYKYYTASYTYTDPPKNIDFTELSNLFDMVYTEDTYLSEDTEFLDKAKDELANAQAILDDAQTNVNLAEKQVEDTTKMRQEKINILMESIENFNRKYPDAHLDTTLSPPELYMKFTEFVNSYRPPQVPPQAPPQTAPQAPPQAAPVPPQTPPQAAPVPPQTPPYTAFRETVPTSTVDTVSAMNVTSYAPTLSST